MPFIKTFKLTFYREGAERAVNVSGDIHKQNNIEIISGLAAATVLVGFLIWYVRRAISIPIQKTAQFLSEVAQGNLSAIVPKVKNRDEIGEMVSASAEMLASLRSAITSVQHALDEHNRFIRRDAGYFRAKSQLSAACNEQFSRGSRRFAGAAA
ncbi:methyl-accepting chemotaxis protein [Paenibacillus sp. FSL K6-3182]|uniref:methyl-accepting chemotaxis protein n=1 Tax=Paenibacillus sp. FSL K6-3182 TaxID=2921495 RepID=UPI0030CE4A6C